MKRKDRYFIIKSLSSNVGAFFLVFLFNCAACIRFGLTMSSQHQVDYDHLWIQAAIIIPLPFVNTSRRLRGLLQSRFISTGIVHKSTFSSTTQSNVREPPYAGRRFIDLLIVKNDYGTLINYNFKANF